MKHTVLKTLEAHPIFPGFSGRFVHSDTMTFAYWTIAKNAEVPAHSHHNEQVVNMLEGEFELVVDGISRVLKKGDVVVIPSDAIHSGQAKTDCRILDVFCPVREPYVL